MRVSIFSALNLMISLQPSIGHGSASVNPTRRELVLWLTADDASRIQRLPVRCPALAFEESDHPGPRPALLSLGQDALNTPSGVNVSTSLLGENVRTINLRSIATALLN